MKDVFIYSRDSYALKFLSGSYVSGILETRVVPIDYPQPDTIPFTVEYVFYQTGCTEMWLPWDIVKRRNYFEDIDDTSILAPDKVIKHYEEDKRSK